MIVRGINFQLLIDISIDFRYFQRICVRYANAKNKICNCGGFGLLGNRIG